MKYRPAPVARDQKTLIPTTLGDLIPEDDPIRLFDELLDKLDWSAFDEGYRVEKRGQPPIPPRIIAAVLIFGNFRRERTSRRLEYQLKKNIEFMWLAHGHQIDHSTFCGFRRRHEKAIKKLQRDLIKLCKQLEVVKLAELYVDGTRIQANANRFKTLTATKVSGLLEQIDRELAEGLREFELADQNDELFEGAHSGEQLPDHLSDLQKRRQALQEILTTCQEADAERKKQGTDPEKNPFQMPVTDQDSRILPNKDGGYAPNYTPVIGVEGELGLIVTTTLINSPNEQDQLIGLVEDVELNYGVTVELVGADAAYSIGTNITELEVDRDKDFLSPHRKGDVVKDNPALREDPTEPVADELLDKLPVNPSTKKFDLDAFVYDAEQDIFYCPEGKPLKRVGQERVKQRSGKTVTNTLYEADSCEGCRLLSRCRKGTGHKNGRRVRRDEHEENRQRHRQKMSEQDAKERYAKRFAIGERPFAIIKRHLNIRRFLTRGKENTETEWSLAITTHNILRILKALDKSDELRARLAAIHG